MPVRHGERPLRLSAFRLRIFFRSFPSPSCPGLTRASMQKSRSRSASTGARRLHLSMDHLIKSGGDESEQWRGITRALTRAARTISLTLPWRAVLFKQRRMRSIGYRTADARGGGVVLSTMRTARSCSPPPARSARDLPLQEGVKSETHRENDEACPRGRATSVTKVATKAAFRPLRASNMFERTLRH